MKVFAYENCEGDKGMIIAASLDEAREIFKKKYSEYASSPIVLHSGDVMDKNGVTYLPLYMAMLL